MKFDVVIIGAGAAGLMCAIESGKRNKKTLIIDHAKKIGEKIRISGGGRCNFTNLNSHPSKFISQNPKFVISALNQYSHFDFIKLVEKHNIHYHEKKLGQLFCDENSQLIIDMLLKEAAQQEIDILMNSKIKQINKLQDEFYEIEMEDKTITSKSLVIASGGLSIPKIGASSFGYDIAKQFHLNVISPEPGLVPLTFSDEILSLCRDLAGLSLDAIISFQKTFFQEGMLFTHKGLSGPSVLQISSYWKPENDIQINLSPSTDVKKYFIDKKNSNSKQDIVSIVSEFLPKRLANHVCEILNMSGQILNINNKSLNELSFLIESWTIKPTGSEGYRTAEVTLGGVDTNELSSKTMMSKKHHGLFFIGEVVDVTGHLGGYNFQWAWSSGYVAGQYT